MARIDIKGASAGYLFASLVAAAAGYSIAGVLDTTNGYQSVNYPAFILGAWSLVNVPLAIAAVETTKARLGIKKPDTISAQAPGFTRGRAIRVNLPSGPQNVFLSQLRIGKDKRERAYDSYLDRRGPLPADLLPRSWAVSVDGVPYTVTEPELDSFLYRAWSRQRNGYSGLSRRYWTRRHSPRLRRHEYESRLNLLLACPGLVVDRGEGRSGRLLLPPALAVKAIQGVFAI